LVLYPCAIKILNQKKMAKIKFTKSNPKKWRGESYLVRCPDYCGSGYQVASWDGVNWTTEYETITEYVTGWCVIEESEN
jgi:hypothetical protein